MQGGVETMQQTSVQKQKKQYTNVEEEFYMFKKMKHMKNEKGLTLIELLAVIVILAIIAAIAIPAIGNIINNSRDKAVLSDVQAAISAAKIAIADGECTVNGTTTVCDETQLDNFTSDKLTSYDIEVTNGIAKVDVVLAKALRGTKIAGLVNGTTSGEVTGTTLEINETDLNTVLGGN